MMSLRYSGVGAMLSVLIAVLSYSTYGNSKNKIRVVKGTPECAIHYADKISANSALPDDCYEWVEDSGAREVVKAELPQSLKVRMCDIKDEKSIQDWEECLARAPVKQLREDFAWGISKKLMETGECPGLSDLKIIARLFREYKKNEKEVEVAPLVAFPMFPESKVREVHLPVTCGYNSALKKWYNIHHFCTGTDLCFSQGRENRRKNRLPLRRASEVNTWKAVTTIEDFDLEEESDARPDPVKNKALVRKVKAAALLSYRDGGSIGDTRFVPIGNDVFITAVTRNDEDRPAFLGLTFAISSERLLLEACILEKSLSSKPSLNPQEVKAEIDRLMTQAVALDEIRGLTQRAYTGQNPKDDDAADEAKLERFEELSEIYLGKRSRSTDLSEAMGSSACIAYQQVKSRNEGPAASPGEASELK